MEKAKPTRNIKLPSFLKGFASAFDITGQTFKFPDFSGGFERDRQAISGDWIHVGNYLKNAMNQIAHE